MHTIKVQEEVYWIGLKIGYFNVSDVVSWADRVIEMYSVDDIPYEIYKLSLAKNKEIQEVLDLFDPAMKYSAENTAVKVILGLLCKDLESNRLDIWEISAFLCKLLGYGDDDINQHLLYLTDVYGDLPTITEEIQRFLGDYREFEEIVSEGRGSI